MIKRAPRPDHGFLIIRNDVLRDERMSYRARGLLAAMLSCPDDWEFNREWLAKKSPNEGVDAIRSALKEMEQCGYLVRRRVRLDGGKFGWEHVVFDTPQPSVVSAGRTTGGSATDGKPSTGNPPSKEEPSRMTVEEDVTELGCPAASGVGDIPDDEPPQPEAEPVDAKTLAGWRQQDRELFKSLVGDALTSDGTSWEEGKFTAGGFYTAFRRKRKKIRWPGRFLASIAEVGEQAVDDWLIDQGLERES